MFIVTSSSVLTNGVPELWYLGNSEQGIDSTDGMVVFGFGRGPGTQPLLRGAGQQFRLGFVERSDSESIPPAHETLARVAEQWLENWSHE